MTFRITGPGVYVNRRGEKVEIVCFDETAGFWFDTDSKRYLPNGASLRVDSYDIVGVWEESVAQKISKLGIDQHTSEYVYDLTKISERFRALEDGRSLQGKEARISGLAVGGIFKNELLDKDYLWSLVSETKRMVTRLFVYRSKDVVEVNREPHQWSDSEYNGWECLGAIEGSEQTEEVDA